MSIPKFSDYYKFELDEEHKAIKLGKVCIILRCYCPFLTSLGYIWRSLQGQGKRNGACRGRKENRVK